MKIALRMTYRMIYIDVSGTLWYIKSIIMFLCYYCSLLFYLSLSNNLFLIKNYFWILQSYNLYCEKYNPYKMTYCNFTMRKKIRLCEMWIDFLRTLVKLHPGDFVELFSHIKDLFRKTLACFFVSETRK